MVVVTKREIPIKYVNWNVAEVSNRLDPRG
jgi:hypothetical protein